MELTQQADREAASNLTFKTFFRKAVDGPKNFGLLGGFPTLRETVL